MSSQVIDHTPTIRDRWVFVGFLALIVWAPLPLASNRTWAIGILLSIAMVLLLGTVVAWRNQVTGAWDRLSLFKWPLMLLACMVSLAWLQTLPLLADWVATISPQAALVQSPATWMTLSLDVYQTRVMAALSFTYLLVFMIAVMTVRDANRLDKLAQVLVWSGVLQSVLGAVLYSMKAQYTIFFSSVSHHDLVGSFINRNHLSSYLNMCLSVGIGLMLARLGSQEHRYDGWKARLKVAIEFMLSPKIRLRLLLVVMVIALVLTRSRMGNASFFTALLVVGALATLLMYKTAPRTIALIVSLVIIDVFVVGTAVGLDKVTERMQQTEVLITDGGAAESLEARTEAARTALPLVRDFMLLGSGAGSFYNVFMSYRSPQYGSSYVDHTHNDYVEIASDFGLTGLSILGLLVTASFWNVLKVMATRRSSLPRGIAFGVAMAIVSLLLHSTVDFNLQIPANALTIVVILAMGWVTRFLPSPDQKRKFAAGRSQGSCAESTAI